MTFLTDGDMEILPYIPIYGLDHATTWYLNGFKPLDWQFSYYYAPQLDTCVVAGVAAGKTKINAAKGLMKCVSIPYFNLLNTSITAKQAELPFEMAMQWIEGNGRLEHHIDDVKLRPWPIISFKNGSKYVFRTCGLNGRFIRGFEYDEVDYDEAGYDFAGETVKVLRSRLRGVRPDGTTRLAKMNVCGSPTDAPWLRERWERGWPGSGKEDLRSYISIRARTRDNTNLSDEQILAMEREYTDEMRAVEMDAEFPDYGMSMFPKRHINTCTNQALNDIMDEALRPEKGTPQKGYNYEEHPRHGATLWELPFEPEERYLIAGDPGIDDPPKRNAGCIWVVRYSQKPARLAYFHWVSGHGSYMPFLNSYKYAMGKYVPTLKLLDTTGPQKALQELAFEQSNIRTDGMNFSRDKDAALNALSLAITNHDLEWPVIKGIIRQLSTYTRDNDKDNDFPQDIVMTAAMVAWGLRFTHNMGDQVKPKRVIRNIKKRTTPRRFR